MCAVPQKLRNCAMTYLSLRSVQPNCTSERQEQTHILLDMVTKTNNAHMCMNIYYKRSNTCYMFRTLMWPSSWRCVTKNKHIEMLQMFVNECACKILNIKITWFKIRITVKNTDKIQFWCVTCNVCRIIDVTVSAYQTGLASPVW
jgi:hypothetical protein